MRLGSKAGKMALLSAAAIQVGMPFMAWAQAPAASDTTSATTSQAANAPVPPDPASTAVVAAY